MVTDSGHLYMFGDVEGGKLGLGSEDVDDQPCDEPVRVRMPRPAAKAEDGGEESQQEEDKVISEGSLSARRYISQTGIYECTTTG